MLRFPIRFIEDDKANDIVEKYLNQRIVDTMNEIVSEYGGVGVTEIDFADMDFAETISQYFPEEYALKDMNLTFWALRDFLIQEEQDTPTLIMEYVMNMIIEEQEAMIEGTKGQFVEPVPERDYCIEKVAEDLNDESMSAEEIIRGYECLEEYQEYYFWDIDFAMLDVLSMDQIKELSKVEELGIEAEEDIIRFEIPSDFYK